jgi:methanogen homocitrate synthase
VEYYYKRDAWWSSLYNERQEVRAVAVPKQKVEIHDATLRDGEQTPGVVFSQDDKLRIAEKLIEAGVTRIEAGMPAVSRQDFLAIQKINKTFPEANIYSFSRAVKSDIDMAKECGVKGVVIEVPIGYPKLKYQFNWTWENVFEKSVDCINYARSLGISVVYFPYDTTRAREEDLINLFEGIMKNSPPDSIGLVDTMGCALPQTIAYMVRWFKQLTGGLPVEVHTHNDFGMAVASELAGIAAGADVIHSCVNGLGERTGNAALEELIQAMIIQMGMDTPYKLDKLVPLCKLVAELSGIPIAPNKPLIGSRNYTRESGIGVNLVIEEPLAMFATDPGFFGRQADIALGKKSGKASVQFYLKQEGIEASDEMAGEILNRVKELGTNKKRLITQDEFKEICGKVLK